MSFSSAGCINSEAAAHQQKTETQRDCDYNYCPLSLHTHTHAHTHRDTMVQGLTKRTDRTVFVWGRTCEYKITFYRSGFWRKNIFNSNTWSQNVIKSVNKSVRHFIGWKNPLHSKKGLLKRQSRRNFYDSVLLYDMNWSADPKTQKVIVKRSRLCCRIANQTLFTNMRENFWGVDPHPTTTRTELLLSGPKSSSQTPVRAVFGVEVKLLESAGRVELHTIQVVWAPVRLHSQRWFGTIITICCCRCDSSGQRSAQPGQFRSL